MTFHVWGDDWEHWDDLHTAIGWTMDKWKKWGRIGTHGKEKYGSFRACLYPYRAEWPIHELVKPGHMFYRWPKWLMRIEYKLGYVVRGLRLHRPIEWWQGYVFNAVIQTAVKRWPNVADELLCDLERYEWLRPGIWGPLGPEIEHKYWRKL